MSNKDRDASMSKNNPTGKGIFNSLNKIDKPVRMQVVNCDKVYLRESPGGAPIMTIRRNIPVNKVGDEDEGWTPVITMDGQTGVIMSCFLEKV